MQRSSDLIAGFEGPTSKGRESVVESKKILKLDPVVDAALQQSASHKFPSYSPGSATLFDIVVIYNGSILLTGGEICYLLLPCCANAHGVKQIYMQANRKLTYSNKVKQTAKKFYECGCVDLQTVLERGCKIRSSVCPSVSFHSNF